jgi:hypothetical protein
MASGMGVAIAALVLLVKIGEQILAERQVALVSLAAAANVEAPMRMHSTVPCQASC